MMSTHCERVHDELVALADGDRDAIARHADHVAGCEACRDLRHDASELIAQLAASGADYAPPGDLDARVLAAIDAATAASPALAPLPLPLALPLSPAPAAVAAPGSTAPAAAPGSIAPAPPPATAPRARRSRRTYAVAGALLAAAAGATAIVATRDREPAVDAPIAASTHQAIGTVRRIDRAATAADRGAGVELRTAADPQWRALHDGDALPAGAELRTDDRTRAALALADGSQLVLDHRTELAFDPAEPRRLRMTGGRVAADIAHVDAHPASIVTPAGEVDVVGTRFALTTTATATSVVVARGQVVLATATARQDVHASEEGTIDRGALSVATAPQVARELAWSELAPPAGPDEVTSGLGALRAYKPGESRDRDWNLALADHEVKVRIVGPIARTEITETFRNDSSATLEGVYRFPLPADAQIDALALDEPGKPGAFIPGAFVDKERGKKIWNGVIQRAAPLAQHRPAQEIIWVPGRWRDPALLEWQRGGRFELRVFPIPANGQRTIKIAYTQVVSPHGPWRQYVYPLAHAHDGSTVADRFRVDVEVRGAAPGAVRAGGYALVRDPARAGVEAMTLAQTAFVPRGDLVVDYRPDSDAELRAWTYTGGMAVAPDAKLADKRGVGIDPKVVAAQRAVANDLRPTAVLALRPVLPRADDDKPRDYAIVVDASQSMVGERYARARQLVGAMIGQLDRRDRVTVLACDSDCRALGEPRAPSAQAAGDADRFLAAEPAAGASDLVAAIRAGGGALGDGGRERWIVFVGDGFASTGFRRAADVERAIAMTAHGAHVTTIGIGSDVDGQLLAAAARGGGGSFVAWAPGQAVGTVALAAIDASYGAALAGATIELPRGLADVAPTVLPTIRAGEEVLVAARVDGDVAGEVIVRGTVGGQPFEQRYPLALAVSSAAGNGFVPKLWAALAIDQLERDGDGDSRARIVALSQGYSVMSRATSLLVLESQQMFDAFGVDRGRSAATWTGEDQLEEVASAGQAQVGGASGATIASAEAAPSPAVNSGSGLADASRGADAAKAVATEKRKWDRRPTAPPAPAKKAPAHHAGPVPAGATADFVEPMVAMRRVWERHASIARYDGVAPGIVKSVADYDHALAASPDSREKHRALVQALAYAGELDRARDVAERWLDRDRLDPQALGYLADLYGRDGKRDLALRTLDGLVDLEPDRGELHERMVRAFERAGRLGQACGHRLALAAIAPRDVGAAGAAVRCLRALGRDRDAELVLRAQADDATRARVEKAATVAAAAPRATGELVASARWRGPADLDVSIITPEGTRVSWMGGRADVVVTDATAADHEQLALRSLKRGNYLVEIGRGASSTGTVRGTVELNVLGHQQALPFELVGNHVVVGRVAVWFESHLEEVGTGQRWRQIAPGQLAPE